MNQFGRTVFLFYNLFAIHQVINVDVLIEKFSILFFLRFVIFKFFEHYIQFFSKNVTCLHDHSSISEELRCLPFSKSVKTIR